MHPQTNQTAVYLVRLDIFAVVLLKVQVVGFTNAVSLGEEFLAFQRIAEDFILDCLALRTKALSPSKCSMSLTQ